MKIILDQAIDKINQGKLVAVPTETVYGVATKYTNEEGVKAIFALKRRAQTNPLSLLIADTAQLTSIVKTYPPHCLDLMKNLWPGPLTLVLPAKESVSQVIRAGQSTVGVRMPSCNVTLRLIEQTGPLVCPSANISGRPSPTTVEHVEQDFGKEFPVLAGPPCKEGIESTILLFKSGRWVILRQGVYLPSDFASTLGYVPESVTHEKLSATQYRPGAKIKLGIPSFTDDRAVIIGFHEGSYTEKARIFRLGSLHELHECQKSLYALLRKLDEEKVEQAYIDTNFTHTGAGALLWERIKNLAN